jgi:opacity protein-like surface antigen
MKKFTVITALVVAGSAYGVGLGAGGFYALSIPMGDRADAYDMCFLGFGGKVTIGVMPYLNVDVGLGYHMKYKQKWDETVGAEPTDVDDYYMETNPLTFGVSYPMTFDAMGVYFGGGGAYVMQRFNVGDSWTAAPPEGFGKTQPVDRDKLGFYAGGGFKYFFTEKIAVDVNPRWVMVLDAKDDDPATEGDESTSNSMYVDFLIGVDYTFI